LEGKDEILSKTDALVFMVGSDEDASQYSKSNSLQSDKDRANMEKIVAFMKEAGSTFGHFGKDSFTSDFAKSWDAILKEHDISLSGGNFNLKLSAESNDKLIHYGTIVYSLGARYQVFLLNL
uniref:FACT complex subunit n=1 Tax=Anisakis simplex TaxID=6269 RepID=A0A0M3KIA8_ANISI